MAAKKITVAFFALPSGAEPVREWLWSLDKADRAEIGDDLQTLEFGWPKGMPVCRAMGQGLYEARSTLKDRIARVLFCIEGDKMVLLHGFIKKSQSTPLNELTLARNRMKTVKRQG